MTVRSTGYNRIRAVFTVGAFLLFVAGAAYEYMLRGTDLHASDYLGNLFWDFSLAEGFDASAALPHSILLLFRSIRHPLLFLLLVFLSGFTIYAPAVSFAASGYASFSLGGLCMRLASKELSYILYVIICSFILIKAVELCVYSAYLGRELARRSPPSARHLFSLPEVRELFILLCSGCCTLLILTAIYYAVIPRL